LPPILEPLKNIIGVWETETTFPERFPVKFVLGGYKEILKIEIADVPAFDTPSLNYTSVFAIKIQVKNETFMLRVSSMSLGDQTDMFEEIGFLWMKPGNTSQRLIGNMITSNTGISDKQDPTVASNKNIDFHILFKLESV